MCQTCTVSMYSFHGKCGEVSGKCREGWGECSEVCMTHLNCNRRVEFCHKLNFSPKNWLTVLNSDRKCHFLTATCPIGGVSDAVRARCVCAVQVLGMFRRPFQREPTRGKR